MKGNEKKNYEYLSDVTGVIDILHFLTGKIIRLQICSCG